MKFLYIIGLILFNIAAMQAATITGVVINATQDSSIVPAVTVYVQKMSAQSQTPINVTETKTNNRGRFNFSIADADSAFIYFAAVDFQGVRYVSDGVHPNQSNANLALVVYDSTHSTAGVEAFMHHIIVDDFGDIIQFRETRVLSNPTKKTITEAFTEEHLGPALFQFHLPAGAINATPLSGQTEGDLIQHHHYMVDRGIFLPGDRTVSFGYELPMQKKSLDVVVNATHPAKTFDLFVGSENITIDSPQLTDKGMFDIRGTQYHRYGVANVSAGANIQFRIRRIGSAAHEQSSGLVIILSTTLLILGLVISFTRKDKSTVNRKPVTATDLDTQKNKLIHDITALDLAADSDKNRNRRRELFKNLQNIELEIINSTHKSRTKK